MANVGAPFGLKPVRDEKGAINIIVGNIPTSNTATCYINTPLAGNLETTTVGVTANTGTILGSAQWFQDATTGQVWGHLVGTEANAVTVGIADKNNRFLILADGDVDAGTTYGFQIGASPQESTLGSNVTHISNAQLESSNGHASANTLMVEELYARENNADGANEIVYVRINKPAN